MSVVALGELLIDFVALESGVTVGEASGFQKAPGGAPANVAVAVARLGHEARFMGQVGSDPFGAYLRGVLADEGVDVRGLTETDEARTMLAFVSNASETGERSFMFYRHPSADMLMSPDTIVLDVLDDARVFHFGSITLITEPARSACLAAADAAREKGLLISYDPNLRLPLWPDEDTARLGMRLGLDYATVLKVSKEELEFLTGGQDVTPLWRDAMRLILVTDGENGAKAYPREGDPVTVPGFKVKPVDTTGAGDAFVAGVLVGILENDTTFTQPDVLRQILTLGNACGALATTQRGAIPALPTRAAADELAKA